MGGGCRRADAALDQRMAPGLTPKGIVSPKWKSRAAELAREGQAKEDGFNGGRWV